MFAQVGDFFVVVDNYVLLLTHVISFRLVFMLVMMNLIPHSQLFSMKSFNVITMLMSKPTKLCQKITLPNLHPNYHQQDKKQFDLQELELQETWLDSVTF